MGAVADGNILELRLAPQAAGESDEEFKKRAEAHQARVRKFNEDSIELTKESVTIDLEPIDIKLFENDADPEKSCTLKPSDLANAGPFIKE
jgi:hypothetical protein